jgi:hypothetical protein
MKGYELRAAKGLLDWTTEDLAFACGIAPQALQLAETEKPIDVINKDLRLSPEREYLIKEALRWAGVQFNEEVYGQLSVSLMRWASVERPFQVKLFPIDRCKESGYPKATFVRFAWFEPALYRIKGAVKTEREKIYPAVINLPNEKDIYSFSDNGMVGRKDYLLRSINHATASYRSPYVKYRYKKIFSTTEIKIQIPLTYVEIDLVNFEWCDLYSLHLTWDEENRFWESNVDPIKVSRIQAHEINSSLSIPKLAEEIQQYPHVWNFWKINALPLEGFFWHYRKLETEVNKQFWNPEYCNRNRSFMESMVPRISPIIPTRTRE